MRAGEWVRVAVAAAVAAALPSTITSAMRQQLVLRSGTTSVAVHVLVTSARGPVRGLTAADFVLKDSGVLQEIATMTVDPLPLDVSVVVDQLQQSEYVKRERHPHIEAIEQLLTPDDRIRVISIGADVQDVVPLSAPGNAAGAKPTAKSDMGAVYDGVAGALLRATPPGRQHVVLVLSEAFDAYSFTNPAVLADIARRSDAQLHVLASEGLKSKTRTLARAWSIKPPEDGLALLVGLARETGGDEILAGLFSRSIGNPVKRIFDDVRAGYVLYYTPAGIVDRGWHPITVTVSRPDKLEVRARSGYAN